VNGVFTAEVEDELNEATIAEEEDVLCE